MDRALLRDFNYIVAVENLASILRVGILSFNRAKQLPHASIAHAHIQERRDRKRVPGGALLHDYANLYVNGRNGMLYARKREEVCVLAVSVEVLELPGVVVTDRNAACNARFDEPGPGVEALNASIVYARSWVHEDDVLETKRHRELIAAEVLVPGVVPPKYIKRIHVSPNLDARAVRAAAGAVEVRVDSYMFFGGR